MSEPQHLTSTRAVYDHSSSRFVEAIGTTINPQFEAPLDRAVLTSFAELAGAGPDGPILDAGCGPGRVARYLSDLGLPARGVDISPQMVEAARAAHPQLQFEAAPITALPEDDGALAGVAYWYSIIATPPDELPGVWTELDRVLATGGQVLVAFQAGEGEALEKENAYGSIDTLVLYRHDVDHVVASLEAAGFRLLARVIRQPALTHETNPQAFLLVERASN